MNCHHVQLQLSLYLYGELDFAAEEALESHLAACAFCAQALSREKTWHSAASSELRDVPLDLLAQCRQELRSNLTSGVELRSSPARSWWQSLSAFRIRPTRWSYQLAVASFLVFLGFTGGRFFNRISSSSGLNFSAAGLLSPSTARIRDIQPNGAGQVRIIFDQVNEREMIGSPDDRDIRQWLLVASRDPSDPGIRVDSVEVLGRQTGADVREALLNRIQHDPNAAVRLKALEATRSFSSDPATRAVLRQVLEHDSDPAVRSEAIDVLAPVNQKLELTPELAGTLEVLASSDRDDYVRERCLQLLHSINDPVDVF